MKKHINIIILILLLLNAILIYFTFFGFRERKKELKIENENSIIQNISVDYEVLGNPLANVKITDISNTNSNINSVVSSLGTAFDISGNFGNIQLQKATVSLKYNKEKLPSETAEDNLGILWYDEKNNKMVEISSKIDKNQQTITFETDHFSEYIFIDINKWHESWAKQMAKIRDTKAEFSVAFVIDNSGSMTTNDPQGKRIDATKQAISSLTTNDRYAIVKFENDATVLQYFTNNPEDAEDDYEEFKSTGGTNIVGAVEETIELLKEEDSNRDKIIILLTDGVDGNLNSKKDELVRKASDLGIVIFGIGLEANENSNLNFDTFSSLATETTGKFYRINDTELSNIFTEITNATVGVDGTIDSDGDGIPDGIEIAGMRDQFGNIIKTSPYLADTDGDGKSDREEIGTLKYDENGNMYYEIISNPLVNENEEQVIKVNYHIGPSETADKNNVWDSGFRINVNALPFRNFAINDAASGGICEGFAILTERVYNGNFERKRNGVALGIKGSNIFKSRYGLLDLLAISTGYDLTESRYNYIFNTKNLYSYVPASEKLKTYMSRTLESQEIVNGDMEDEKEDSQLIKSLYFNWVEGNTKKFELFSIGDKKVTEKTISQLKDIFKNDKKIVTIQLPSHGINGYALEKAEQNLYLLYVYDNNYPYDPLSANQKGSSMSARNNVILLIRNEEKNIFGETNVNYRAVYYKTLYLTDSNKIYENIDELEIILDDEYSECFDEERSNKDKVVVDDLPIHIDYEYIN